MKSSSRVVLLVGAVCCLAIVAGVLAVRAFAWGQDTYCDGCTLPASGVPAVSAAHHPSFYFGNMNTGAFSHNYFYEEIYFYSATANKVMCAGAALTNQRYHDANERLYHRVLRH